VTAVPMPANVAAPPASVADASSGRLTVEERRAFDLGSQDGAVLETLIAARPYVGVFLSTAWLAGFRAEPPDGAEPLLLVMREGGTLRGVVPLGIQRRLTHVRVMLLGGGAGSDRVDLLAARGCEAACADLFLSWLAESFGPQGFVLELRDVPGTSPLWGAIHRAGLERSHRLALVPQEIHPLPYLDLLDRGSRSSGDKTSGSLARHRRWLEHRCRLRIETLHDTAEVISAFDTLTSLLRARWRGHGESVLDHPRAQRFHRRVLPLLVAEGRLRMIRLSADMRPIAVYYGLAAGSWSGYYLAGYDREWAGRIHLGQIALATAMDLMAQEGATEFDFLKGAERVKYSWPVRERVTVDADLYSQQSGPQLVRATRSARAAAIAFARTAKGLITI
jgi:CelD/BcsL family acetyltransferase involved in cellulose biosynthesis